MDRPSEEQEEQVRGYRPAPRHRREVAERRSNPLKTYTTSHCDASNAPPATLKRLPSLGRFHRKPQRGRTFRSSTGQYGSKCGGMQCNWQPVRGRRVSVSMSSLANGMGHIPHVEPKKDIGIPPKADASCEVKHGKPSHSTGGRPITRFGSGFPCAACRKTFTPLSEIPDSGSRFNASTLSW